MKNRVKELRKVCCAGRYDLRVFRNHHASERNLNLNVVRSLHRRLRAAVAQKHLNPRREYVVPEPVQS